MRLGLSNLRFTARSSRLFFCFQLSLIPPKLYAMELSDIVILIMVFLLGRFWWQTLEAREAAERLCKTACVKANVQLLDGTVSLKKLRLEKSTRGGRMLLRYFGFEFSVSSDDRRQGVIAMHGGRQQYLVMDLPEQAVITVESEEE